MARVADFRIETTDGCGIDVYRTTERSLTIEIHTASGVGMEAVLTLEQATELRDALRNELER